MTRSRARWRVAELPLRDHRSRLLGTAPSAREVAAQRARMQSALRAACSGGSAPSSGVAASALADAVLASGRARLAELRRLQVGPARQAVIAAGSVANRRARPRACRQAPPPRRSPPSWWPAPSSSSTTSMPPTSATPAISADLVASRRARPRARRQARRTGDRADLVASRRAQARPRASRRARRAGDITALATSRQVRARPRAC